MVREAPGATLAPIEVDVTYPLAVFKRIAGMGDNAIRKARRHGLVVQYVGRNAYVSGKSFQEYLNNAATPVKPGSRT